MKSLRHAADNIPVHIGAGEAVLPAQTVKTLGGAAGIDQLIRHTTGKAPRTIKKGGKYAVGGLPVRQVPDEIDLARGRMETANANLADQRTRFAAKADTLASAALDSYKTNSADMQAKLAEPPSRPAPPRYNPAGPSALETPYGRNPAASAHIPPNVATLNNPVGATPDRFGPRTFTPQPLPPAQTVGNNASALMRAQEQFLARGGSTADLVRPAAPAAAAPTPAPTAAPALQPLAANGPVAPEPTAPKLGWAERAKNAAGTLVDKAKGMVGAGQPAAPTVEAPKLSTAQRVADVTNKAYTMKDIQAGVANAVDAVKTGTVNAATGAGNKLGNLFIAAQTGKVLPNIARAGGLVAGAVDVNRAVDNPTAGNIGQVGVDAAAMLGPQAMLTGVADIGSRATTTGIGAKPMGLGQVAGDAFTPDGSIATTKAVRNLNDTGFNLWNKVVDAMTDTPYANWGKNKPATATTVATPAPAAVGVGTATTPAAATPAAATPATPATPALDPAAMLNNAKYEIPSGTGAFQRSGGQPMLVDSRPSLKSAAATPATDYQHRKVTILPDGTVLQPKDAAKLAARANMSQGDAAPAATASSNEPDNVKLMRSITEQMRGAKTLDDLRAAQTLARAIPQLDSTNASRYSADQHLNAAKMQNELAQQKFKIERDDKMHEDLDKTTQVYTTEKKNKDGSVEQVPDAAKNKRFQQFLASSLGEGYTKFGLAGRAAQQGAIEHARRLFDASEAGNEYARTTGTTGLTSNDISGVEMNGSAASLADRAIGPGSATWADAALSSLPNVGSRNRELVGLHRGVDKNGNPIVQHVPAYILMEAAGGGAQNADAVNALKASQQYMKNLREQLAAQK